MSDWKSKANWKDRNWKYTTAAATDITKTIARIKRELKEIEEAKAQKPTLIQFKKAKTG